MRWWEAFDSPELNALVERAIAHNYSLKASNATLERARQRIAVVAGKQLPQVDANARMAHEQIHLAGSVTSAERGGGKACAGPGKIGGSASHYKKKKEK